MTVLYTKFNRERLLQFQTYTSIIKKEDGSKTIVKRPLNAQAKSHIQNMVLNKDKLKTFFPFAQVINCQMESGGLYFPFIEGKSFDSCLFAALQQNNEAEFFYLIDRYISFLKRMSSGSRKIKQSGFLADYSFSDMDIEREFECFSLTNIDMSFENLFLMPDEKILILDYEWVFEMELPILFLLYRSLHLFYWKYRDYISFLPSLNYCFSRYEIQEKDIEIFNIIETGFQNYVMGSSRPFTISDQYVKPVTSLRSIERELESLRDKNHMLQEKESNIEKLLENSIRVLKEKELEEVIAKRKYEMLENKNSEYNNLIAKITDEKQKLEGKLSELNLKTVKQGREAQQKEAIIKENQDELAYLRKEVHELDQERNDLMEQLKDWKKGGIIGRIVTQLGLRKKAMNELDQYNQRLMGIIKNNEARLSIADRRQNHLNEQVKELSQEVSKLANEKDLLDNHIKHLENELHEARSEEKRIKAEKHDVVYKLEKASEELKKMQLERGLFQENFRKTSEEMNHRIVTLEAENIRLAELHHAKNFELQELKKTMLKRKD